MTKLGYLPLSEAGLGRSDSTGGRCCSEHATVTAATSPAEPTEASYNQVPMAPPQLLWVPTQHNVGEETSPSRGRKHVWEKIRSKKGRQARPAPHLRATPACRAETVPLGTGRCRGTSCRNKSVGAPCLPRVRGQAAPAPTCAHTAGRQQKPAPSIIAPAATSHLRGDDTAPTQGPASVAVTGSRDPAAGKRTQCSRLLLLLRAGAAHPRRLCPRERRLRNFSRALAPGRQAGPTGSPLPRRRGISSPYPLF